MSAIRTLLDLAEACSTCKIIIGLSPEHASCEGLACSLLRLGFQVISVRKCPLLNDAALLLEFDLGPPAPFRGNPVTSSDYTCSGTSECSTSAEDLTTTISSAIWSAKTAIEALKVPSSAFVEAGSLWDLCHRARSLAIGIGLYVVEL
eukprot:s59_g13.t1